MQAGCNKVKTMNLKMRKKLNSQAGETITEVLVSLLIAALALTMLAGMISSTVSLVTRSKETMNRYYEGNAKLEQHSDGEPATVTIKATNGEVMETPGIILYENHVFNSEEKTIYAYAGSAD